MDICPYAVYSSHIFILAHILGAEDKMFNDNWYLFLLIVMLAFYADGNINDRESAVMLSILFALTLTNSSSEDTAASTSGASESNCFCDHSV